jgi:hypothetical protein
MRVVTLSAAYGTCGGIIGPSVAKRLGVPFVDRAIPARVADDLGISLEHALSRDEQVKGWLHRLLSAAAPMSSDYMMTADAPRAGLLPDGEFVACTERAIRSVVTERGGVILGRGAALVLWDHPTALHVRLDGDEDRRVSQAMRELRITEDDARGRMKQNDGAREAYVRHFYHADATDCALYDIILDSTRLPLDTCVEMIAAAAMAKDPSIG